MARFWACVSALAVSLCVMAAPSAGAAGSPDPHGDQNLITMNFQNVDIPVLAKFISQITGKNFVIDESVRGKVSIISPTKVTPEQAYSIFQSVLQLKGFTTVQAGPVIKIVPSRVVRESAALTQSQVPAEIRGDEYVTRMVKLRNVDATSLVSVIQPMVSHDGLVAAFPQDNILIITDDAYNVQRLLRIIGSLDVRGVQQNVAVIPLKYAFADSLAGQIQQIMGVSGAKQNVTPQIRRPGFGVVALAAEGPSGGFNIVPDERTNALVVLAGPIQMRQIKELVRKLDIRPPYATARIHVYRLKNAQATEVVQVLNGLLGGGSGPTQLSPQTGRNSLGRGSALGMFGGSGFGAPGFGGASYGAGSYGAYGAGFSGSFGGGTGSMGMIGAQRGGSKQASAPVSASTGGSGNQAPEFEKQVNVTADPATNSLVISASPQDYETLSHVIEQLDVPRVQVFVQAVIVEISQERSRDIGVTFLGTPGLAGNTLGVGELNFGQLQTALGNPLGLTGLGLGLASGSQCNIPASLASTALSAVSGTSGTVTVPCDIALMTALATDVHSNVLSAPTLLTADNEEAMIVVGQNVPFLASSSANAGLPGQIFNSVDRQNVGITLDIVPQVSQGDSVRLDVYEEVSSVVPTSTVTLTNPLGPTTTIRAASTTVMVQDNRTAVIGGLLSDQTQTSRQGVPFLSDIPVIGNLFSDHGTSHQKQNLLVFLTPHVVRTRRDLVSLSLDQRQKFIKNLGRNELYHMPTNQLRQVYSPSFSVPISPGADLRANSPGATAPQGGVDPAPSRNAPVPFRTENIGPSSRSNLPAASTVSGGMPGATAGSASPTH
jgi:general secretion pathway protein D